MLVGPSRIGEFAILPAGRKTRYQGVAPAHLDIRLDLGKMEEMAAELRKIGERRFEFVDVSRMRDPVVEHIGAIFRAELNRAPHPAQDLLIGSLAVALSAHLLRSYTNAVGVESRSTISVDVAAVRRAMGYIKDNPARAISLQELASAAGLSLLSFQSRVQAPSRPVARQICRAHRIEQAKALIVSAEMSLAHVAQAVGFADQSHFSRRFRFQEGRTPAAFAREQTRRILPS